VRTPALRVGDEIVRALTRVSAVRAIASFGSVATGSTDEWSDVDLFVACDDVERGAWLAAAAIHQAKPVLFYRTFSIGRQPSGRYWFANESPFNRLDVSFYSPDGFEVVCRDGLHADYPVTVRSEYQRAEESTQRREDFTLRGGASKGPQDARLRPIRPLDVTPAEQALGRLLYTHLEAAKANCRNHASTGDVQETRTSLVAALSSLPMTVGGDFQRLARAALEATAGGRPPWHIGEPAADTLQRT